MKLTQLVLKPKMLFYNSENNENEDRSKCSVKLLALCACFPLHFSSHGYLHESLNCFSPEMRGCNYFFMMRMKLWWISEIKNNDNIIRTKSPWFVSLSLLLLNTLPG